jgi:hypothetical protein
MPGTVGDKEEDQIGDILARSGRSSVSGISPSGQITMRKVDGWQTLAPRPTDAVIDLAA